MKLLIWLELRKLRNQLRAILRSPVRLLGALCVVGWLVLMVVAQVVAHHEGAPGGEAIFAKFHQNVAAGLFAVLLLITYAVLDRGLGGDVMAFTASEVDFLFPAPVPRRSVLGFRLCLHYIQQAFFVGMAVFWLSTQQLGAYPWRTMACAAAALFAYTVLLANVGTLLAVLITFHGDRVKLLPGGVKAAFAALAVLLVAGWANGSAGAVVDLLQSATGTVICLPAALAWQFMAAGVVGAPAYAAAKLGVLYLLALLSWLAVVRRPENLYEPSTDSAVFWYDVRQAMKTGSMSSARALMLQRRKARFRPGLSQLAPFGRRAGVLLWRNVVLSLRSGRNPALGFLAVTVLLPLGVALALRRVGQPELERYCPLLVLYLLFVANTVMLRAHQGELQRANLLRPLPLPAWQVVLCQTVQAPAMWLPALIVGFGVLVLAAPGVDAQLCLALAVAVPPLVWLLSIYGFGLSLGFSDPQNALQNLVAGVLWLLGTGVLLALEAGLGVALWVYGCSGLLVGAAAAVLSGLLAVPALALAAAAYRRFDPTD